MIKISIIIPVYNMEKRLNKCIDSVLNQNFESYEVILVNDGSTDNSGKICNEYKRKDDRIKVIHTKNKGVSSARNTGISISQGKYLMFIDSDDWIEKNTLELAYSNIIDSDIIIYGFCYDVYKRDFLIKSTIKSTVYDYILNRENINKHFRYLFNTIDFSSSCNKLFKKSIIDLNNIRFMEKMSIFEDLCFNIEFMKSCKNMKVIHNVLYHYTSDAEQFHLDKRKFDIFEDIFYATEKLSEYCTSINLKYDDMEEVFSYYQTLYSLCLKNISQKYKSVNLNEKLNCIKKLSKNENFLKMLEKYSDNIFNKYLSFLLKRNLFLLSYFLIRWKVK